MGIKMKEVLGSSKFLKAADVDPPQLLTIAKVSEEEVGKDREQKYACWFEEIDKGFVVNVTNGDSISEIAGSDDSDDWVGTKIVLFKDKTDFGGRRVDCIRVRVPKGKAAKQIEAEKTVAARDAAVDEQLDEIPF